MPVQTMKFSGSTAGQPILITATSFSIIHTAVGNVTDYDQIFMWISNFESASRGVIVAHGNQTSPGTRILNNYTISANSPLVNVVPGLILNNGGLVSVAAVGVGTINLFVSGYVQRITP